MSKIYGSSMECAQLQQEWKRVTPHSGEASKNFSFNALDGGIIDMVSRHQDLEIM